MKKDTMTIVLFGASGRTGREILVLAGKYNLKFRAVVRNNRGVNSEKYFDYLVWDFKDNRQLEKIISGCNAVIIVFGPKPPYADLFCSKATEKIVKVMEKLKVNKLICQTGAMIGDYKNNRSYFFNLVGKLYRKNNPQGYQDRTGQEEVISRSSLDWTIFKPPRLTDSRLKEKIIKGESLKVGMFSSISRKSLAEAIIEELLSPKFINKKISIKSL